MTHQKRPPTPKQEKGNLAEHIAHIHLSRHGLICRATNFRCKTGEIDLIFVDGETLVFVEVRYRKNSDRGSPLETVTSAKQAKLRRTAQFFLQQNYNDHWPACRFDVVGILGDLTESPEINWIQHAFY